MKLSNQEVDLLVPSCMCLGLWPRHPDELAIPSVSGSMNEVREDTLLCTVRAVKQYVSRTERYHPACSHLYLHQSCEEDQQEI